MSSIILTGTCPEQALYTPQVQPAGARVGPFSSSANCWSGPAGSGFDFANSRWFGVRFWRSGNSTNNQTLFTFNNAATTGWRLILGNDRSANLFFGSSFINFIGTNYLGLQHLLVGKDSGGNFWGSLNGQVGSSFAAPGAYVAGGASAVMSVGADKTSASFAATQTSILQNYVLDGVSLSPTDMSLITGDKSSLDRWHAGSLLTGNAALVWFLNWESWNGTDATFAGTGSGAIVLTRNGTGGGKSTMGAFDRYRLPMKSGQNNGRWNYYERGNFNHDTFTAFSFSSNAADTTGGPAGLVVENYAKALGIVGNSTSGVSVNGTNLAGNNVGGAEVSAFDMLEAIDVPGIVTGAGKPFVITESIQAVTIATEEIKCGASPQAIRVPHGSSVVFTDAFGAVFTDCECFVSDSLLEQEAGLTDVAGVKGPAYDAAPMLQRAANPTKLISCICTGGDTWFNNINDSTRRAAFVDHIRRQLRGTSTNHARIQLVTNDFGFNTYLSLTTFKNDLASFFTQMFAAGITGLKIQIIGTTDRTGGTTPNPSGFTLADFRTAESDAVTAFGSGNLTYVSAAAAVSSGNKPDGLHYNQAGHLEWSNFATANPVP